MTNDEILHPLDSIIALPFKVYSAQETLRIALVVDRIIFAIGCGVGAAYVIPVDISARTQAQYYSDWSETETSRPVWGRD